MNLEYVTKHMQADIDAANNLIAFENYIPFSEPIDYQRARQKKSGAVLCDPTPRLSPFCHVPSASENVGGDALVLEDELRRGGLAEGVDADNLVGVLVPGGRHACLAGRRIARM